MTQQDDTQPDPAIDRVRRLLDHSDARLPIPIIGRQWRRQLRELQRLTTTEAAEALDVSRSTLSAWEAPTNAGAHEPAGENRRVYAAFLALIAERHGIQTETTRDGTRSDDPRLRKRSGRS